MFEYIDGWNNIRPMPFSEGSSGPLCDVAMVRHAAGLGGISAPWWFTLLVVVQSLNVTRG
jgi:hypothetical protein